MKSKQAAPDLDLDEPVYGGEACGKVIKKTKEQFWYGFKRGYYDATKNGRLVVSTPRKLLKSIGIEK